MDGLTGKIPNIVTCVTRGVRYMLPREVGTVNSILVHGGDGCEGEPPASSRVVPTHRRAALRVSLVLWYGSGRGKTVCLEPFRSYALHVWLVRGWSSVERERAPHTYPCRQGAAGVGSGIFATSLQTDAYVSMSMSIGNWSALLTDKSAGGYSWISILIILIKSIFGGAQSDKAKFYLR